MFVLRNKLLNISFFVPNFETKKINRFWSTSNLYGDLMRVKCSGGHYSEAKEGGEGENFRQTGKVAYPIDFVLHIQN